MMHHGDGDFLQADMGATYFYAFDGIIFEVTSTFHISSAIVFSSNTK